MQTSLCASLSRCSLSSRPVSHLNASSSFSGTQLLVRPRTHVVASAVFQVTAKQNSLKRQRTAETARVRNKSRKSEIATRMKKVFVAVDALKGSGPTSEEAVKPVESLISEAYAVIDKAVVKGVLHINTGARRKARLAKAKREMLISVGLYTPAPASA